MKLLKFKGRLCKLVFRSFTPFKKGDILNTSTQTVFILHVHPCGIADMDGQGKLMSTDVYTVYPFNPSHSKFLNQLKLQWIMIRYRLKLLK